MFCTNSLPLCVPSLNGGSFRRCQAHVEPQRSHGKGPMDGVGGTVKNIIFRKVKSGFVTIDSPFEFHQAILKFVPSIKSVYLPDTDVLNEPENIEQESKKIPEILKVHHVERFEVKGVYGSKFL